MNNLVAGKAIAVIGGGPVGLCTARLLQQKGARVTVYERDTHAGARLLGGTLDIHEDTGQKALAKAGLLDELFKYARPVNERMGDTNGTVLMETLPPAANPYERPEIDRPDLRNLLLASLQENTVVWNTRVLGVREQGGGFAIHCEDNRTAYADLVFIADGAMSKARKLITTATPEPTGTFCIQGTVADPQNTCPDIYNLVNKGNFAVIADKKALFIHTRSANNFCYYASFRDPADQIQEQGIDCNQKATVTAFLQELFAGWHPVFKTLFDTTDEYTGFPLRAFPHRERWVTNAGCTLLGDAAHVMPPFGGMGVNLGLLDALIVTENLTEGKFTDVKAAIANYEQRMFAYAMPLIAETCQADDRIHTSDSTPAERLERMAAMKTKQQHQ